ncbi:MAG: HAD family phosphatase [Bacteriovoracaceae bacterium]
MHHFEHVPEIDEIHALHPGAKACLFDMDGTLMNTEIIHAQAMFKLLEKNHPGSFTLERLADLCLGQTDSYIFQKLREENFLAGFEPADLESQKNSHFLALLETTDPASIFFPEVKLLLEDLTKADFKLALVTSSDKHSSAALLEFLKIGSFFEIILTKESTEKNKPHPDPYLKALEGFGLKPQDCVIFEDSPTGLAAAKRAGAGSIIHARWY